MSSVYSFRCWTPQFPRPLSTLVIFGGPDGFNDSDLVAAITLETKDQLSPEAVIILASGARRGDETPVILDNETTFAALSHSEVISIFTYNRFGDLKKQSDVKGSWANELPLDHLRQQGLTKLFVDRGGALDAGPTLHFVKPSGRPDSRFLRASQALAEGVEIFFVALWILPYLSDDLDRIAIDSASIASLAMAVLLMSGRQDLPTISTFHSYEGLESFRFGKDSRELVLISASQSGKLAHLVKKETSPRSKIVTVFATNTDDCTESYICSLDFHTHYNPFGLKKPRIQRSAGASAIPNTRAIKLIGEHFTARIEKPQAIVPKIKHAPNVVKTVMSKISGSQIFRSNKSSSSVRSSTRGLWIDSAKLMNTVFFNEWLTESVRTNLPASTKAIIYAKKDSPSEQLANKIRAEIKEQGGLLADCKTYHLQDLEDATDAAFSDPVTILVAGDVTGHGEELMSISRALRKWAPKSHRVYFLLGALSKNGNAFEIFKSSLEYPSHRLFTMLNICVDRERLASSWNNERDFLKEFEDDLPAYLHDRCADLDKIANGLVDKLFLPSGTSELALRDNFAFWPEKTDCTKASQADVFACVAAIMENMRTSEDLDQLEMLLNDSQTHTLLSPTTFSRFNDGVIQASWLRAALPIELNYQEAADESRQFSELVCQMINLHDKPQGEALSEFFLALVLGKCTLMESDSQRIIQRFREKENLLSETNVWLGNQLVNVFGSRREPPET
jgi:hypothetical protein